MSCTIRLRFRRAIAESRRHANPAAIPNNNNNDDDNIIIIIILYFITGLVRRCVSTHTYLFITMACARRKSDWFIVRGGRPRSVCRVIVVASSTAMMAPAYTSLINSRCTGTFEINK